MPAYNFKGRFADKVRDGSKPHTIRPRRKHPTKVGDTLYLYTGMRTKNCVRLRTPTLCTKITPIIVQVDFHTFVRLGGKFLNIDQTAALAIRDGFQNSAEFFRFFRDTYGPKFEGELIEWSAQT